MIKSEDVRIKLKSPITNEQIEVALKDFGFDVLRWAITDVQENEYNIRISYNTKEQL